MNRKYIPMFLMLAAGAVTCVISFVKHYTVIDRMVSLLVSLIIFYFLGSVLKWTLDYFDAQNEEKNKEEGEVIRKEAEGDGENGQEENNDSADNKQETNS